MKAAHARPEVRAKYKTGLARPEVKAKRSASMKAVWADPRRLARLRASCKAARERRAAALAIHKAKQPKKTD
jgi:hypothetical protein